MTELPPLPWDRVRAWLAAARPELEFSETVDATVIAGGLSNITYRIDTPVDSYILRRPPYGPLLPRAHDMGREHRVMTALAPTQVPVPETVAHCNDPEVIGAPFYLMRTVEGEVLRTGGDTGALTVTQRTSLAEQLIDTLVDLHAVDLDATGLADFGRHGGYAGRQVRTWSQQWIRSRTRNLPDMDALIGSLQAFLDANAGMPDTTTLVHGDYRLDNTIVRDGRIAAVLDWELSTLGDPLADLGSTLTYWHDPGDDERRLIQVAAGVTDHPGFPTGDELAERYAERTGRDLTALAFHRALGAMKLGVILEGVHARHLAGPTVGSGYSSAGEAVPVLAARGLRQLRTLPR